MSQGKRRVALLMAIMAAVAVAVAATAVTVQYQSSLELRSRALADLAANQAATLTAHAQTGDADRALRLFRQTPRSTSALGETGELVVARRDGDSIEFLMQQRGHAEHGPTRVRLGTGLAEPMARALAGQVGTMVGRDYRGRVVLAAYQPVQGLGWGLVAKVDLAEVRAQVVPAAGAAFGVALLLVAAGSILFTRFSSKMVREVEASEERFRLAAQSLSDVVYEWDLGGVVRWYGNVDELLGHAPGGFPHTLEAWVDVLHPDDRARAWAAVERHLRGEAPYDVEYRVRSRSGEWRRWHARGTVARGSDGTPRAWVGAVTDVTERKQAEEEIRELNTQLEQRVADRTAELSQSEQRFRRLTEAAFEAILVHEGGVLLQANDQYFRLFGYEPGDLLGKQVIPLTVAPESREVLREQIAAGGVGPYEATGLRRDGTTFPIEIRAREMEYEGRPARVAAIVDISERKRAEEEVRRLNEDLRRRAAELEAANKELEAFAYSVSHDLRAPLRTVDGFSRILLDDHAASLPAEARRYLGLVRAGAQDMGRLIDDLLAFSRLSRQELRLEAVAVDELVEAAWQDLAGERAGREVELVRGQLPACNADPRLLRQVLLNLLSNAVKFTRTRPHALVEVGSCMQDGHCVYYVRDNGVGFDMQYSAKLFGVFQRLHRAEEFEGNGVGLAIVQRVVHRHGGRVWAEAEPGRGATFHFTLGERTG